MSISSDFTSPKNKETWANKQYEMVMKQYEMLVNSIASSNETRENSNNFWITVNALIISGAAYVRDTEGLSGNHKYLLMWTLVILGSCLCIAWINYLSTLKKNIELKNNVLVKLESYFPTEIFTSLLGYAFFIGLLLFFPNEVATHH